VGVYPKPFLDKIGPSVTHFIEMVDTGRMAQQDPMTEPKALTAQRDVPPAEDR
jgi:hypothetical protein